MQTAERLACLELALTPHVGAMSFLKLLQAFPNASTIWSSTSTHLNTLISQKAVAAIFAHQGLAALQAALNWEAQHPDNHLLCLVDDDYPLSLSEIDAPPPLLFARGNLALLQEPSVAIIGSRHASPSGLNTAQGLAAELSRYGVCIVSGFAAGIDTAAHQGCIQAQGTTIAVLGTGIDRVYPAANRDLAHQISASGLLLSEFPLTTAPIAHNFPRRNRIIAGLSQAIVVVEATLESGSLITARLGLEMNKEVMAVPGSIHNPHSKGCHALIKQGAKLVESVNDILEECPRLPQIRPVNELTKEKNTPTTCINESSPLLKAMGFDPIHPDQLVDKLGISATDVYAELLQLELQGKIAALSGGRYQRIT